jgi:hypothetical protein
MKVQYPHILIKGGPHPTETRVEIDGKSVVGSIMGARVMLSGGALDKFEFDYAPATLDIDAQMQATALKHVRVVETGIRYTIEKALMAHRIVRTRRSLNNSTELACECGWTCVNQFDPWQAWATHVAVTAARWPKETDPPQIAADILTPNADNS